MLISIFETLVVGYNEYRRKTLDDELDIFIYCVRYINLGRYSNFYIDY